MQKDSKIKLYKEYVNLFNQLEIVVQKSTELNEEREETGNTKRTFKEKIKDLD